MNSFRNDNYCKKPFTKEIPQADFYTHINIYDLIVKCKENIEKIIKFRTVGIIESIDGHFYIKDINSIGIAKRPRIIVSMAYMKTPLQNTILPYTAQVFGTIQWKGRPVIYAYIIQVHSPAIALKINEVVGTITRRHLAERSEDCDV
ncbi:unnamed protein product, partial [Brenthis ino]